MGSNNAEILQARNLAASRRADRLALERLQTSSPPLQIPTGVAGSEDEDEDVDEDDEEEEDEFEETASPADRGRRLAAMRRQELEEKKRAEMFEVVDDPENPKPSTDVAKSKLLDVVRKLLIRALCAIGAGTLVGIIVPVVIMNLQLVCGNILGMKAVPKLSVWGKIGLILLDLSVFVLLVTVFVLVVIILVGPFLGLAWVINEIF